MQRVGLIYNFKMEIKTNDGKMQDTKFFKPNNVKSIHVKYDRRRSYIWKLCEGDSKKLYDIERLGRSKLTFYNKGTEKEYNPICKASSYETIGNIINSFGKTLFGIDTKDILLKQSYGFEYRNRGLSLFDYGLDTGSHRLEVCDINTVKLGMVYVSKSKELIERQGNIFKYDMNRFMYYKQ